MPISVRILNRTGARPALYANRDFDQPPISIGRDSTCSVVLDDHVAESWLAEARRIPGWADGPEYAPHPVRAAPVDEEDADL